MNTTRRADKGLGKTAAGGSGGSFAAHDREPAPPPKFRITASNPRGLNYDHVAKGHDEAKAVIQGIAGRGAEGIQVNGIDVPPELIQDSPQPDPLGELTNALRSDNPTVPERTAVLWDADLGDVADMFNSGEFDHVVDLSRSEEGTFRLTRIGEGHPPQQVEITDAEALTLMDQDEFLKSDAEEDGALPEPRST